MVSPISVGHGSEGSLVVWKWSPRSASRCLSLLCEAHFYLCFVMLVNNGRAVNRSCLALWFPMRDRKTWPLPSSCSCPRQGSSVQQELSWVRQGLGVWGEGLGPAVRPLVPVPSQSLRSGPSWGNWSSLTPELCSHPALSEQPLHLGLLFLLQLILKASKNVQNPLISATSLFPHVKYFGEQSVFGFGGQREV